MLEAPTLKKQIKKSKLLGCFSVKIVITASKNLDELTILLVLLK
jgi:hypothetical protein